MSDIPLGEIHLQCPNCGATERFGLTNDASEDSRIVCKACRQTVCTVSEFNAEVIRRGKAIVPDVTDPPRKRLDFK